ncbi:MAG TPA: nitrilase-related carbon-nitrogen hydrolase [Blastocatellia bacterium]|nr:nitrilase-related carbon-nitrogen hydrolase [Blastocatellia bacterium]
MKFTVALAQIKPVLGDLRRNLEIHREYIARAVERGSDLIVFPELSLTGYYLEDLVPDVALDPRRSDIFATLAEQSEIHDIDIVVGFVEVADDFRFFNAAAYLSHGELRHIHRKVYLPTYGMFDEGRYLAPGEMLRAFDTRWGRMGMLICEDMWHPSTTYVLAQDGAQVILCLSAGPGRGVRQQEKLGSRLAWETITRAASQAYMIYTLYVNRVGFEDGAFFSGGSEVVDPFGRPVVRASEPDETLLVAELDQQEIRRARTFYPLLRDERLDLTLRELKRIYAERHRLTGYDSSL